MSNSAITISNLFFSYTDSPKELPVISNLNLKIKKGEFVSIIGPSGCGKTTLIHVIAGLIKQKRGRIIINKNNKFNINTAIAFQDSLLFPWRNVIENISYGAEIIEIPSLEIEKKCRELIALMHLDKFKNYYPHQLSGGMKQRVNIARALCVDPNILLLDEPFSNLDPQIRELMQEELLEIYNKTKKTFILITHNIEEAVYLSDRIVVLSKRPAKIKKIIKVNFKRPKNNHIKNSREFIEIKKQVGEIIKNEIKI